MKERKRKIVERVKVEDRREGQNRQPDPHRRPYKPICAYSVGFMPIAENNAKNGLWDVVEGLNNWIFSIKKLYHPFF